MKKQNVKVDYEQQYILFKITMMERLFFHVKTVYLSEILLSSLFNPSNPFYNFSKLILESV